jgi:hypothetical protein
MKNGEIKNQGHIVALKKTMYQNGYNLIIKLKTRLKNGIDGTDPIKNALKSKLDAVLRQEYAVNETFML